MPAPLVAKGGVVMVKAATKLTPSAMRLTAKNSAADASRAALARQAARSAVGHAVKSAVTASPDNKNSNGWAAKVKAALTSSAARKTAETVALAYLLLNARSERARLESAKRLMKTNPTAAVPLIAYAAGRERSSAVKMSLTSLAQKGMRQLATEQAMRYIQRNSHSRQQAHAI